MSELFTELTDQQQELVAGGAITTLNVNATDFFSNTEALGAAGGAASGPSASTSVGNISGLNQEIFTNANSIQAGQVD